MREYDFSKVCGIAAYVTCYYCKGKKRLPGGKYRDQGEVVDCPICDGLGAERVFMDLDQLQRLVTIVMNKTKSRRRWTPQSKKTARRRST
jgi:hypothetical protein